jgi:hypothetical protein
MRKNIETIHVGGHVPPTGRRAVVVTEGPPDMVAIEPEPAAHSPRDVVPAGPQLRVVPPFDTGGEPDAADVAAAAQAIRDEEDAFHRAMARADRGVGIRDEVADPSGQGLLAPPRG